MQSVAVSPHVKSPSDPRGQGSIVRPHLPVALSVLGGPRDKAEGRGPRPAVHQRPLASSWRADDRRRLPQAPAQAPAQARHPHKPWRRLPGHRGAAA